VLAIVFSSSIYIRWLTSLFCIRWPTLIFFHLKAEQTEERKQHLSKTEGKKTYLQISPFSLI
jgi:hypothetical protein